MKTDKQPDKPISITEKLCREVHNLKIFIFLLFLVLAVISVLFLFVFKHYQTPNNSFIDENVANLGVNDFLKAQDSYHFYYASLRQQLYHIINESHPMEVAIYFEDLKSRAWIGINERDRFVPASLLKVPTSAAALKMVEEGEISLSKKIIITQDDLNSNFGTLYQYSGNTYSIDELIQRSLVDSDNTATLALTDNIPVERLIEARLAMGLPIDSIVTSNSGTPLSARDYSNIFKSLYISSYLSRESSNYLLHLMNETNLSYGLREGVPRNLAVSHKIGVYGANKEAHDCGIVYLPNNPYILCIMTKNATDSETATKLIENISRTVYNFVNKQNYS